MNELIIGVDPGLHCGFAILDLGTPFHDDFNVWEFTPMEACDRLHELVNGTTTKKIRVSIERYTLQGMSSKKTSQNDAVEIIGAMRWICRRARVPFAINGSSDASKGTDRETLKKLGFWVPGKPDHYQRATAQVVYTLKTTHPSEYLRRLGS